MIYPKKKIREIAKLRGGKRLPLGTSLVTETTAHPYIRGRDIRNGRITFEDPVYVTDKVFPKIKSYTVNTGDVCVTIVGNIGDVGIVPTPLSGANLTENAVKLASLVPDCDPLYLMYALLTPGCQSQMKRFAAGAAQPKLGLYKVEEIEVPLPTLLTQRKIAAILSAYDDLIENNTRRIKILEQMAQAIYREWFVEFRAPGVELRKATLEEQRVTGKDAFPKKWEVKSVGELLELHIGGGWGEETENDQFSVRARVIRGTDIPDAKYGNVEKCPLRFHKPSNYSSRRLIPGDIVFEVSGGSKGQPVGRSLLVSSKLLGMLGGDAICASFCRLLRSNVKSIVPELLFLHFQCIYSDGRIDRYQVQSTGIINFKFEHFLQNEMVVTPDIESQSQFIEMIRSMLDLINTLNVKNASLRRTRDLLLPKLISGEVGVEKLDIETKGGL